MTYRISHNHEVVEHHEPISTAMGEHPTITPTNHIVVECDLLKKYQPFDINVEQLIIKYALRLVIHL